MQEAAAYACHAGAFSIRLAAATVAFFFDRAAAQLTLYKELSEFYRT